MRLSRGLCLLASLGILFGQLDPPLHPTRPGFPEGGGRGPVYSTERQLQDIHQQNLDDTSQLIKLSRELKWDLANNDRLVLSMATVKKMDEIERLIKRIRSRVGKK